MKKIIFAYALVFVCPISMGQTSTLVPDLSAIDDGTQWVKGDRDVSHDGTLNFKGKKGEGPVWLKNYSFTNGRIEVDIKGKNLQGQSFVGIAFHIVDGNTYDAIYFRPFNFFNPERNTHSVQYISLPDNTWQKLREQFPGKFESKISNPPNPDDWFHVTVEVKYPKVSVFVNDEKVPSLVVDQISTQKKGSVGLWVGNMSDGNFRNLKIQGY